MTSPPSSLPSPTPSTSSSSHPHTFSSLAMPPPAAPNRAPSAASGMSAGSGRDSKASGFLSNGNAVPIEERYPSGSQEPSQQTPQPQHNSAGFSQHPLQHHPFLPPVTSSPPPHVPPYVPPPQHAMAPDPIHTLMGQNGVSSPSGMVSPTQGGWTSGQNGWRGGPSQAGYTPTGQQFPRQMPNGHTHNPNMVHQLPPNPIDSGRGPLSFSGMNGRPGSRGGESRERRRDRDAREDRDGEEEVITTIFVVGFPDDMLEREFQNIFTFSPGFEAATLKFPSGANRGREPAAALLAELQQLAASQMGEHGEHAIPPPLEEALAALQLSTASSSSTTPSAAISMTPSAPTGPVLANQPYGSQSTRRQTIGFARFKTRADALAAREHLQGRKIDTLTGATLKAEMAKKNLHTKRTTSGEELVGLLLRSGRLAGLMGANTGINSHMVNGQGAMPPHIVPSHPGQPNPPSGVYAQAPPPPIASSQSAREAWDSWPHSAQFQPSNEHKIDERINTQPNSYAYNGVPPQQPSASAPSNASTSPPLSVTSPGTRPSDSKALLALAEEADEMEGWSVGGAVGMGFDGFTPRRGHPSQPQPINHAGQPQAMGMGGPAREAFGSSPPAGSDHMSDAGRSMGGVMSGANPADQNPPINTLYVGNLPAISPPTLPPNFLEESLRVLFQTCPGYKRMSFRQKINGPMCFVEFEDVGFAANAIQTLYGHSLNGLVKGGIRLSYSKNSLGQRGANHPIGANGPSFGGIAHTVALAGMSPNSFNQANLSAPPNAGYGLQLHGHGQSAPSGPNPAPIPVNQPSHSAPSGQPATSLSPNAQPFALPSASPRSRYFGSTPSSAANPGSSGGAAPVPVPVPVPIGKTDPNASFHAFQNASTSPSTASGQFSPVRTPASFSWVSSGSGVTGNGGYVGLGSLDGAASAWGSTPSSGGNNGAL